MKLAVYVHVPFCKSKCVYCDFYSVVSEKFDEYFSHLLREIDLYEEVLSESEIKTVYFGGGTPSVVPPSFLKMVLEKLERVSRGFTPDEITIEVNPESVETEKLKIYKQIGINRISLGVQACDDTVLKNAGRLYKEETLKKKAKIVLEQFENVNFDFILGLPGETDITLKKDFRFLEEFPPQHVSLYLLEVDERTRLFDLIQKGLVELPEEDDVERRHDLFVEFLKERGFLRYEISNFAKPGKKSLHNLFYWRNENYLGLGVSAGGHIGRLRYVNASDLKEYEEKITKGELPYEYVHENTEEEEALETVFMGLRIKEGVELNRVKILLPLLEKLQKKYPCYLKVKNGKIFLSEDGMNFSKKILSDLIEWYREGGR
ncbi:MULTISPECIES: radical SAM family heme chaperone HemW [unclassified Thermotoga]|uniref:radical SAM family heme chaperone HemW n=1 Tax=unclassified Thermotoga TaxID=2631113 RepID=UPI000540D5AB|nr:MULTISPECIES: radical SAM family heme chaperone HemW [unclassified Thermotoga]AIY88887.1 oxygen-independent coproporphyrinogen III oxidase [Thermotoga sp. Cell2]KHC93053.1 oxygen-independent coproporphyrinogen III oxidase [Thermotoga sp. TBGT1765]KHC94461.1 oxygen-independent coproporphyrinogen III oxidase [Thermotoga sp. TBGT1766]KHC95598.1 oxygen-independent coproporphyrinogen III oxidase [Thermotoga sp. Xyl54]